MTINYSSNHAACLVVLAALFQVAPLANPLAQLQRHRFFQAIENWEKDAASESISKNKLRALKGQAIAYYRLGSLYQQFQIFFNDLSEGFYAKISKNHQSPTLLLYQGQTAFYKGDYAKAFEILEKVAAKRKVSSKIMDMTKVYRHFAWNNLHKRPGRLLLTSRHPSVTWQLMELDPNAQMPQSLSTVDSRSTRNKLAMLLRQPKLNAIEIKSTLKRYLTIIDEPEIILNKGKLTQVNFYDPISFKVLSQAFFTMSNLAYEAIRPHQGKFPTLDSKFNTRLNMAKNYLELHQLDRAQKLLDGEASQEAKLVEAQVYANMGRDKDARKLLDNIANTKNPIIQREAGYAYFSLGINKVKGLKLTVKAAKSNKTPPYYRRYGAILFGLKKNQEALEVYAKGYKIQYRNSVEHIDPEYMTEYSRVIFKSSKMRYDEVVETLYHLQKAYPNCRAMHYCMQGIAAAEGGSFENTKIFKKGG